MLSVSATGTPTSSSSSSSDPLSKPMKILAGLCVLSVLAACSAPLFPDEAKRPARARLAEPSGLEEVSLVSKGLE